MSLFLLARPQIKLSLTCKKNKANRGTWLIFFIPSISNNPNLTNIPKDFSIFAVIFLKWTLIYFNLLKIYSSQKRTCGNEGIIHTNSIKKLFVINSITEKPLKPLKINPKYHLQYYNGKLIKSKLSKRICTWPKIHL